jgi:hypothetical protein
MLDSLVGPLHVCFESYRYESIPTPWPVASWLSYCRIRPNGSSCSGRRPQRSIEIVLAYAGMGTANRVSLLTLTQSGERASCVFICQPNKSAHTHPVRDRRPGRPLCSVSANRVSLLAPTQCETGVLDARCAVYLPTG